jgi:hypothetical protein
MRVVPAEEGWRIDYTQESFRSTGHSTSAKPGASMGLEEVALEPVEAGAESAMVMGVFGFGARPRRGRRSQWAVVRG